MRPTRRPTIAVLCAVLVAAATVFTAPLAARADDPTDPVIAAVTLTSVDVGALGIDATRVFTISAVDAAGTTIATGPDSALDFELELSGAGTVSGATDGSLADGTATETMVGRAVGPVSITAVAGGLSSDPILFDVVGRPQSISFPKPEASGVYGSTFAVDAAATSGLAVEFGASGGCEIDGRAVTVTSATTSCTVIASQAGDAEWAAAPSASISIETAAATLGVDAVAATAVYGEADPDLSATISGFVRADDPSILSGSAECARSSGSAVGTYVISCRVGSLAAANYSFVAGSTAAFVISRAGQSISLTTSTSSAAYGTMVGVGATATSGLPVDLVASGGCVLDGDSAVVMTSGSVDCGLTASQPGDSDHTAASVVTATVAAERAEQAPLELTAPTGSLFGHRETIAAGGGSGTGAISFIADGACELESASAAVATVFMASGVGDCDVEVMRAGDADYRSRTASIVIAVSTPVVHAGQIVVDGTRGVGFELLARPVDWSPAPVGFRYQWLRDGVAISGATANRYTLITRDAGVTITVAVTGSRTYFSDASRISSAVGIDRLLTRTPTPTISGSASVGSKFTAHAGNWAPAKVTLRYQWLRDGTAITGATGSTYVLKSKDRGTGIRVVVTGSKAGYSSESARSASKSIR